MLWIYLVTAAAYWWVLVPGALMPGHDVWELIFGKRKSEKKIPRWVELAVVFICLSIAQFLAYRNVRQNLDTVIYEKQQLSIKVNQLSEIKPPELFANIDSSFVTLSKVGVSVFAVVSISNRAGAASGANDWTLRIEFPDQDAMQAGFLFPPAEDLKFDIHGFTDKGVFRAQDFLPGKTEQAICAGCQTGGWVVARFPQLKDPHYFSDHKAILVMEFKDIVTRQVHTIKRPFTERGITIPGLTPTK